MDLEVIEIYRRDTFSFTATVKEDGKIKLLNGYVAKLAVKKRLDDLQAYAIGPISGTINDPATGEILFSLSSTDTNISPGRYYYDIEIYNSVTSDRKTVSYGYIDIIQDVCVG